MSKLYKSQILDESAQLGSLSKAVTYTHIHKVGSDKI